MAKNDLTYTRKIVPKSTSSGGWGRFRSHETWLAQTKKDSLRRYLINEMVNTRLAVTGAERTSSLGMSIRQSVTEEIANSKAFKQELDERWSAENTKGRPLRLSNAKLTLLAEAEILTEALYSATKARERENLDEGDVLDDPVTAVIDGAGWGDEIKGKQDYRKHVNLCIDNSGSTHLPITGFCSKPMNDVCQNMARVLKGTALTYEGVTWAVYDFNKVARNLVFYGKEFVTTWDWLSDKEGTDFIVKDPLEENALHTNLAPLMEEMYHKEVKNDLLDEPRIDIILTDGEFENQEDADLASEWQRKRGSSVNTYVLNLCPELPSDVSFPPNFRVIPLNCVSEADGAKEVDLASLRNALYDIVIEEMVSV